MLLKFTSSSMVQKMFRLKCGHNILPANKFKFDPTEKPNCAECGVKYDKFHMLMNCKKLELYHTHLKAIVNDNLQMYHDKPVTMNMKILLGETILPEKAALTKRTFLTEILTLAKKSILIKAYVSNFSFFHQILSS